MSDAFDTFDAMMAAYGFRDVVVYDDREGFLRYQHYSDGGWIEGIRVTPVVFWGA